MKMRTWVFIGSLTLGGLLPAQAEPLFKVLPSQCAIDEDAASCEVELVLAWSLMEKQDICILQDNVRLTCIDNTQSGQYKVKINSDHDIDYVLINKHDERMIEQITFPIMQPAKKRVHLRKVPWRVIL